MPTRWNYDHQYAILDGGIPVAPGAPHEFTDEQIKAGIAGPWSDKDPRRGLPAEHEFKRRRDAGVKPRATDPATDTPADSPPAEPDDATKEQPS